MCMQCVYLPGTFCPTGTARSFQSFAATPPWMIHRPTTRRYALPGRGLAYLLCSRRLLTNLTGRTSWSSRTTRPSRTVGTERSRLAMFSATTRTTLSRGSGLVLIRQTKNSTTFFIKSDHAHEVSHYVRL